MREHHNNPRLQQPNPMTFIRTLLWWGRVTPWLKAPTPTQMAAVGAGRGCSHLLVGPIWRHLCPTVGIPLLFGHSLPGRSHPWKTICWCDFSWISTQCWQFFLKSQLLESGGLCISSPICGHDGCLKTSTAKTLQTHTGATRKVLHVPPHFLSTWSPVQAEKSPFPLPTNCPGYTPISLKSSFSIRHNCYKDLAVMWMLIYSVTVMLGSDVAFQLLLL